MRRPAAVIIMLALLGGCGERAAPVPSGAQAVHVVIDEAGVHLDPAAVPAGDVYVVLDTPGSSVGLIQGQDGPLSDEALARIAENGDTAGTSMQVFDQVGCSAEQRSEDLGHMGPCGNVSKVDLGPGKYLFYSGDLTSGPPDSMAVLEVLP